MINQMASSPGEAARPGEAKRKQIAQIHGTPCGLAPFLACLCTEQAGSINGSVFGVAGSGEITCYSEPVVQSRIHKDSEPWTIEELTERVPQDLLRNYHDLQSFHADDPKASADGFDPIFDCGTYSDRFHAPSWLNLFVGFDHPSGCSAGNVVFAPGAHKDWHVHPGWQLLLVTDGEGYLQEEGKEKRILRKGDVVLIEPGVRHWHGATEGHWFSHIGIIPGRATS